MNGDNGYGDLDDVLQFVLKKELYEQLEKDTTLLDSSLVLQMFFLAAQNTNIGYLAKVDQQLRLLRDSIISGDSLLKEEVLINAKNANDEVQPDKVLEENMKTINGIKLATIVNGIYQFNETQQQQIESIASQCPFTGGKAVYDARGLYALIDEDALFDDIEICNSTPLRAYSNAIKDLTESSLVSIYPNPTSSKITVNYWLEENKMFNFIVTNVDGRVIYSTSMSGNTNALEVDLSKYVQGIYFYRVVDDEKLITTGKISLIK